MKDLLLIPLILGVFVFGYFLMRSLDKFLDENHKAIKRREEVKEPSFIMIEPDIPTSEIEKAIERFKIKHPSAKIFLYDSQEITLPFNDRDDDD